MRTRSWSAESAQCSSPGFGTPTPPKPATIGRAAEGLVLAQTRDQSINQSGQILGFGLIADRPIGSVRAIHSHRRRTSRRIAPSNQSNQSFLRLFGRTNSIASISRWIVGGIPIGPMNATKGGAQPRTPTGLQGHRLPSHCYTSTSLVAQKSQTRPKPGCKPRRGLLLA